MRFRIYEGDLQEVPVKNTMPWIPGEFVMEHVSYMAKSVGVKKWYAVLSNGSVIELMQKNRTALKRVGELCKFHHEFSKEINSAIHNSGKNADIIKSLMKNRKRTYWQKEERMRGFGKSS